ncbi:MAG: retroviral-like aspartic protease family protein [Candidatus Zixiibacteriota bacterium]
MNISRLILYGILLIVGIGSVSADEPDDILNKFIDAVGGLDKIAAVTSQSGYYTVDYMGLSGKAEILYSFPDKYYMKMEIGPMTQIMGCDGMTGWRVDDAGLVSIMSQAEMRPIVNALYYASYSYIIPNRIAGRIEYRGTEDMAGTLFHQLACYPEGGDSVFFKINDKTGLMDYQISYEGDVEMLNHSLEYRQIDGLTISWKETMMGRGTPITATQSIDSIFFNRHIPDSLFNMPGQRGIDYNFADEADSIVLPIHVHNDHVFLDIKIDGLGPFSFLLDSGAGKTVVAKSVADRLGIKASGPIAMRGIGGFGEVSIGEIDSLTLGKLSLHLDRTMIADLSMFHSFDAGELGGVLGYDFFVRFPMTLNFEGKTLTLYNPGKSYRPTFANMLESELYFQIPLIMVELNGRRSRMLFDLGAQTGILLFGQQIIDETLREDLMQDSTTLEIMGVGGVSSVFMSTLDSISIGTEKIQNPKIIWSDNAEELPFRGYIEGIIGTSILKRYKVYMDYQGGKIGLDPAD